MLPEKFFVQFASDYEKMQTLTAMNFVKFEMPFENPGCQTCLNGRPIVSFASNDYLSMVHHPDIKAIAKKAIDEYGTGAGSSMLGSGSLVIHHALEEELADYLHKEAAVLFPTGFSAMLGFCSAHIINNGCIYADAAAHRCIIDGIKLGEGAIQENGSNAKFFKHNSLAALEKKYTLHHQETSSTNYDLLITEGVFSMNGDQAPLQDYLHFSKERNILTAIDDAHGIGVLGDHGRGTASAQNLLSEVDFVLGTFSKTFATTGGFIAGPKEALQYLRLLCGVYMFSASMVPVNVQVVRGVLNMIRHDDSYQKRLWENVTTLKKGLDSLGLDYGDSNSAVVPIYIRDTNKVLNIAHDLLEHGFYVLAAFPPAVGIGEDLLRVSVNAAHTPQQITQFLETLSHLMRKYTV